MMTLPILPGTTAVNTKSLAGTDAADEEDLPTESGGDDLSASPALNGFASLLAAVLPPTTPPVNPPAKPSSTADGASASTAVEEISANPRPAWKSAEAMISSWSATPPPAPLGAESGAQAGAEARLLKEVKSFVRQAAAEMGVRTTAPDKVGQKGLTFMSLRLDDAARTEGPVAEARNTTGPAAEQEPSKVMIAEATPAPEKVQMMTPLKPALREAARVTAELLRPTVNAPRAMPSVPDSSSSPPPLPFVSPPGNDMTWAAVDVARAAVNTPMETTVTGETAPRTPNTVPEAVAAPQGTGIAPSPAASNFDKKAAVDATSTPSPALSPATAPQPVTAPRVLPEPPQRITNASAVSEAPQRAPGRDAKSVAGTTSGAAVRGRAESRPVAPVNVTAREIADSGTGSADTSECQPGGGKREGQSSLAQEGAKESAPAFPSDAASEVAAPHVTVLHAAPAAHDMRPADHRRAESVVAQTTQLVNAAESAVRHEARTLRFDLRPEHLGRVEVELTRSGEGHVRAHLTAERGDAGQSLSESIGQLRESLERAGVTVDRLEVSVRTDLSAAGGHGQHRRQEHPPQTAPASSAYPGLEQPEADDAPRAVEEDRIISLRA